MRTHPFPREPSHNTGRIYPTNRLRTNTSPNANALRKREQHPWSSSHHYRRKVSGREALGMTKKKKKHIPQFEVLASLQRQLLLGLALGALQSQHNLLGGLGLLVEDGLGLTTVTALLPVVTTLTLGIKGRLQREYENQVDLGSGRSDGRTLPALYCVTLCWVCLRQSLPLQYVRRVLGTLT